MFTKEEMEFTVQQMINNVEFLIGEISEYDDAIPILNLLKEVVKGNQEKAKEYWYNELCVVAHDFDTYMDYVSDFDTEHTENIIAKLYPDE